jgi:hypothetical protein
VLPAVVLHTFLLLQPTPAACADAAACRQAALEAAAREDFEAFHDLAWRAAQKSRPNDPELMYLLARAQSLSGRPGDALVMLRRLAQMSVATDAATNDDFRRVRALAGWSDLEALIASIAAAPAASPAATAAATPSAPPRGLKPDRAPPASRPAPATAEAKALAPARDEPSPAAASGAIDGEEAMRLTGAAIDPVGLAYDSASKRFVLGDRRDNKLIVADEVFNHVNDLIGAASGGFGRLSAVEIDTRRGDLWVTSSDGSGASVHKLQLVSGRVLARLDIPATLEPVAISDFAILDSGALMLLDSEGGRLLRVGGIAGRFEAAVKLRVTGAISVAPAGAQVYVAHDRGLSIVEPGGQVSDVAAPKGASLTGLRRIRWNRGSLLALQGQGDSTRVIRIRLTRRGHAATAVDLLDRNAESAGTALTITRDAAYYVAQTAAGATIRRIKLR